MDIKNEHKKSFHNNEYYNSLDIIDSSEINSSKYTSCSNSEEKKSEESTPSSFFDEPKNNQIIDLCNNNLNNLNKLDIIDDDYNFNDLLICKHNYKKQKKNKFLFLKKQNLLKKNESNNCYKYSNISFNINEDNFGNLFLSFDEKKDPDDNLDKKFNIINKENNNTSSCKIHKQILQNSSDSINMIQKNECFKCGNKNDNYCEYCEHDEYDHNGNNFSKYKKWIIDGIYNNDLKMVSEYLNNGGSIYNKNNNILNDALLCNYLIGNTIYILLCDLQINIEIFNLFKNTDDILIDEIKKIMYYIITEYKKYGYFNLNKQKILYDEKSFNFKNIYDLYNEHILNLYNKINEKFKCTSSDFICINIKKLFDNMFFIYDKDDYIKRLADLLLLIDSYFISTKIVKLLFNQQIYEYITNYISHIENICNKSIINYKKNNKNKCTNLELLSKELYIKNNYEIHIVNNIESILKKNSYIDVNYINLFEKSTILINIISKYNFPYVVEKIFDLGFSFPNDDMCYLTEYDLILISLEKKLYTITIILLEKVSTETLNREYYDTTIYFLILNNKDIDIKKKIKMLKILIEKDIDFTLFDSIKHIIDLDNSHIILDTIIKNKHILKNFTNNDIILSIKHKNNSVLKILLDNGIDINGKNIDKNNLNNENYDVPIFVCIDLINKNRCEYKKYLDIFFTILEYKPKLEILNNDNDTPLLYVLKTKNPELALILLDNNADPFAHDVNDINCLMYAVMYDYIEIVKKLIHIKKNDIYLVNIINKDGFSVFHSLLYSSKPIQILSLLQKNIHINYDVIDNTGLNIIDNILESSFSEKIKQELCKNLIDFIDVKKINKPNTIPSIIRAINNNYMEIVIYILYNLVVKKELIIKSGNLEKFLNGKCDILIIDVNNEECNFYSLVVMYLKNIIYDKNKNFVNTNSYISKKKNNPIDNKNMEKISKSINEYENANNENIKNNKINNKINDIINKYQYKYIKNDNLNNYRNDKKKILELLKNNFFFILIIIIKKIYYLKNNNCKKYYRM